MTRAKRVVTKRVVMVFALALAACSVTKVITRVWHSNAEVTYEVVSENLKFKEDMPSAVRHPIDRAGWESRRMRHLYDNLPTYGSALLKRHLSALVDDVLVWIVLSIFLLKVMFWAAAKMFNGWVDGAFARSKSLEVEQLENGDVVIHFRHENMEE